MKNREQDRPVRFGTQNLKENVSYIDNSMILQPKYFIYFSIREHTLSICLHRSLTHQTTYRYQYDI